MWVYLEGEGMAQKEALVAANFREPDYIPAQTHLL